MLRDAAGEERADCAAIGGLRIRSRLGAPDELEGGLNDLPILVNYKSRGIFVALNRNGATIAIEQVRLFAAAKR